MGRRPARGQVPRPFESIVAVAAGSALGGVGRYLIGEALPLRTANGFPFATLAVNVVGCFAAGFIAHLALTQSDFSPTTRTFLLTGICGGFTTFSAFSLETVRMVEAGASGRAAGYVALSLVLGAVAVVGGLGVARLVVSR
jgi:fluoride exporter